MWDIKYNKDAYVFQVRFLMQKTAGAIIEIGKRLLVIREREGKGNFIRIIEEDIGIPYRTAFRFMNTALKAEKFPVIEQFATVASCNKVYTLLEAPEEDLKKLEEEGVLAGKDMDELAAMSVKEMRELIRELKTETSNIIQSQVKKLSDENKLLRSENNSLRQQIPKKDDDSWATDSIARIHQQLDYFLNELNAFAFNPLVVGNGNIKAKVEGLYQTGYRAFLEFIDKWESYTGHKVR